MSFQIPCRDGRPARRIRAEAASWVARLHGPDRNVAMERGLKEWLAEDPAHAVAFELATAVWQETGDLPAELPRHGPRTGRRWNRGRTAQAILAMASVLVVLAAGWLYLATDSSLRTAVGEQRTVTMSDGTRIELNTDSEIQVKYDERVRRVVLKSGEAYFDVAERQSRPFVVVAGDREVVALGTEFLVRQDSERVTVTLLQGRVAVGPGGGAENFSASDVRVLHAGQRLTLALAVPPVLDSPPIEKVTAWQRGQLIFEDTPLSEAAAEFNRYSVHRIRLGSTQLGEIRVGGTFRVGDSSSFARAVAQSNGLEVVDRGHELLLTRIEGASQPGTASP